MPPTPSSGGTRSGIRLTFRKPERLQRRLIATSLLLFGLLVVPAGSASADIASGVISGVVFFDSNRNGVMEPDEQPIVGERVYLIDVAANADVASTTTDADGRYALTGLSDGTYRVDCDAGLPPNDWVPTTTGTIYGKTAVSLTGSRTVDFGWRQIVRSSAAGSPISAYVGSNGLRVESYNDVVQAKQVYDDLMRGSLVGSEAQHVTIRFDLGGQSATSTSVAESNGVYSSYKAASYVTYLSWRDQGDNVLFHEYGHAWSLYYAYIVQQDPTLSGYLKARGLSEDSRVGSSYQWHPRELVAEDYRQLFGTPSAAAYPQVNQQIAAAAQVSGLRDYLTGSFTQPPPSFTPSAPPPPALAVTNMSVAPTPVSKSGTVTFTLSVPASTTVTIVNSKGAVVRTLLAGVSEPSGTTSVPWDRRSSSGQRVKPGTYNAQVAASASGEDVAASIAFEVA